MTKQEIYIVELESGLYLGDWEGDPGRTKKIDNAKVFKRKKMAKNALIDVLKYRSFPNAKISTFSTYE